MKESELCAEANWLFVEEQRLMKQDDPSVPEGTVTYKHAVMYYVKKDGTKSTEAFFILSTARACLPKLMSMI